MTKKQKFSRNTYKAEFRIDNSATEEFYYLLQHNQCCLVFHLLVLSWFLAFITSLVDFLYDILNIRYFSFEHSLNHTYMNEMLILLDLH